MIRVVAEHLQPPLGAELAALVFAQVDLLVVAVVVEVICARALERAVGSDDANALIAGLIEPAAHMIERSVLQHVVDDVLDLRAHEINGAGNSRAVRVDLHLWLEPHQRRVACERLRQHAASHWPRQRVCVLRIEPPKAIAAVCRHPVKNEVADRHKFVVRSNVGPGSLLDRRVRERNDGLRIKTPEPVAPGGALAVQHIAVERQQLVALLDVPERTLRCVGMRAGNGIRRSGLERARVEVPQRVGSPTVVRYEIEQEAAQRNERERLVRVELLVAAARVAEIGEPPPEFRLEPLTMLQRQRSKRVARCGVELEEPERIAGRCGRALLWPPFKEVAADPHQCVEPVIRGPGRHRRNAILCLWIEAPHPVNVFACAAADQVAWVAGVAGHRRSL